MSPQERREARADQLIREGKVALVIGHRFALVTGSKGKVYRVSRESGCECPDFRYRDVRCAHLIVAAAICDVAHMARHLAKRHGRCRLPAALGKALANGTARVAS